MRRGLLIVAAGLLPVLLSACGPPTYHAMRQPPPTVQPPTGLEPPRDFTGLRLAIFPGRTTTTQANVDGKATLNGTITANGAPVGGATVVAERYVDGSSPVSRQTVSTGDNGGFTIPNLVGGRYRLRAFRSPDMGMATGQVFFLGNTDTKTVNMTLDQFTGLSMASEIAPNPPIFSDESTLAVRVTQRVVDGDGNVTAAGVSGISVALTIESPMQLVSSVNAITDSNGDANWTVSCGALGSVTATFTIAGSPPLISQLPPCSPPPTTTTTSSTIVTPSSLP